MEEHDDEIIITEDTESFTPEEYRALYDWIKPHYIHYENTEMLDLVKKLRRIVA